MIDRVPEELGTEVYDIVQEAGIKTVSKKKKCKKIKRLSEEVLQIAEKRRTMKGKGETLLCQQKSVLSRLWSSQWLCMVVIAGP